MPYKISFTKTAEKDIIELKKSEPYAYEKVLSLLREVVITPFSGTGKPKPLGKNRAGQWSRRITLKHRLVYTVDEESITVSIISASGHYDDK